MEVRPRGEDTAEQNRGVDRGALALLRQGLAGLDVVEVRKETVLVREDIAVEPQGAANLLDDLLGRPVRTLIRNAQGLKVRSQVAAMLAILRGSSAPVLSTHFARSSTCPVWGAGLFRKEQAAAALQLIQKGFVFTGEDVGRLRRRESPSMAC